jgi:hypothetical protein
MHVPSTHWLSAAIATVLLAGYLGPVVVKLADVALWVVVVTGFAMMLVDLWQSLTENHTPAGPGTRRDDGAG